jgi:hypothetical protein
MYPLYLSKTRSSPLLISSHICPHVSSELSSHVLITLFVLALVSCPHLYKKSSTFASIQHLYSHPSPPSLSYHHPYYPHMRVHIVLSQVPQSHSITVDNPNTTQTLKYTKDKYNVKIIKQRVSPKVPLTTYKGQRIK